MPDGTKNSIMRSYVATDALPSAIHKSVATYSWQDFSDGKFRLISISNPDFDASQCDKTVDMVHYSYQGMPTETDPSVRNVAKQ